MTENDPNPYDDLIRDLERHLRPPWYTWLLVWLIGAVIGARVGYWAGVTW